MIAQEFRLIEAVTAQLALMSPSSQFGVSLQLFFRLKRPIAKGTPIASVDVHVGLQGIHRVEHLPANRTDTIIVALDVLHQISLFLIASSANLAHVWSFFRMHLLHVLLDATGCCMDRWTKRALNPLSGMFEHVIVQRDLLGECFRTVTALERFFSGVRPEVHFESTLLCETHMAVLALEILDTEVNFLM